MSGVVGGGAFRSLFRSAVLDAHRAIFTRDRDTVTLTLADVGTVVAAALEKLDPQLAADLDAGNRVVLLQRDLGELTADVVRAGERLRVLAWILAALTLAAAIGALVLSRDRRRTVAQLGVGVAAAGLHDRDRLCGGARLPPRRRRRAGCGTPSSATCARSAGCWPAPACSSPPRRSR